MEYREDRAPPRNWQDFEDLCLKLWRPKLLDARKHGRAGQPQAGVDIYGRDPQTARWIGIQCKQMGKWPPKVLPIAQIEDEIQQAETFEPSLAHFIIATTAQRDAVTQAHVRKLSEERHLAGLFTVDLFAWDDIQDWLLEKPDPVRPTAGTPVTNRVDTGVGAVRRRIKSFVAIVATIVLAVGVVGSGIYFWRESRSRAKYSESGLTLPAAYHESPEQIGVIGRLALLEVAATEEREVSVNHRWQTGDTFRVVVSANHAGWLYLFHRPPNGELTLLWPEDETETKANAIRPREPLKVPKGEDVFQFVGGTGLETFYVALSAEPEVPEPGLDSPQNRVQAAEEFITRSLGSPESLSRDVIIARPQLSELYLYFAPADPGDVVAVDFQLQHREGAY